MERKQLLTVSIDQETAEAVRRLAEHEFEGNRSQATRRLIKLGALVARASEADMPTAQREKR
jgi:hypothetical protein